MRRAVGTAVMLTMAATGLAGPAAAAPPLIEREVVNDTFVDEFLSEACGVEVTATVTGFVVTRQFERSGVGVQSLTTISLTATLTSGDNTFRFRDVGADIERTTPSGDRILSIIGKIPFGFNGILKINLDTGEVVQEPRDISQAMTEKACAALTA